MAGTHVSFGDVRVHMDNAGLDKVLKDKEGPVFREMVRALELGKDAAKAEAPVGKPDPLGRARAFPPGNLRDRIVKRVTTSAGGVRGTVGTEGVPYAMWVHEGTQPHDIRPVRASILVFAYQGGPAIHALLVHHPGNEPDRFLVRAMIKVFGTANVRPL